MAWWAFILLFAAAGASAACKGTVYLTLDTGTMEPAESIADILRRHDVKATFFLTNESTQRGDAALDPAWAPYWKPRASRTPTCASPSAGSASASS